MKRVTISLDDQLYRLTKSRAQQEETSHSKMLIKFIREGLEPPPSEESQFEADLLPGQARSSLTGLVVSTGAAPFTSEDVYRELENEDDHLLPPSAKLSKSS